jgi:hypothetical protein
MSEQPERAGIAERGVLRRPISAEALGSAAAGYGAPGPLLALEGSSRIVGRGRSER